MGLQVPVLNAQDSAGSFEVSDAVFGANYNETLIHQLVVKYLAGARSGTKAQKNRSEVSGGGSKPWRQKGTGHARSGTSRSPIWRTGGVSFAARPRSFEQKLNKKMYKAGIKSIFSELLRQNRLTVSNDIVPSTPKTKQFVAALKNIEAGKILIITEKTDQNLYLAARNVPYVRVSSADELSPVLLISADQVVATPAALKQIEERLA